MGRSVEGGRVNGTSHIPVDAFEDEDEVKFSVEELVATSPRCTDAGNADAFVRRHGSGFRYVLGWQKWIAWNGRRWEIEGAEGRVIQAALLSVREDYALAKLEITAAEEELRIARVAGEKDKVEDLEDRLRFKRYVLKWHEQSQNVSRLNAIRTLLQSSLVINHDQLDTHPTLFNAPSGTVDLTTGEVLDHDREHMLTQMSPIEYDPHATCPVWEEFLETSLGRDGAMINYLQRVVGFSITGSTQEHVLLFFYGGGNNGKSTFFTTLLSALGDDYGCAAPPDLLFMPRGVGAPHPTEIASLYGKRVASCAELGDGQKLDEAKVKRITGGDPIRCRRMHEDWWTFTPTHTIFMSGNHKPNVSGVDNGIWRRVKLIPWTVMIADADIDKALPSKLLAELPGILAWAVRGCLEWQRIGFSEPELVKAATAEYRRESDLVGQFLEANTVCDSEGRLALRTLRERYESWCKDNGYETLGGRRFNERLRERGAVKCSVRQGAGVVDGWRGLRLKTEIELLMSSEPTSDAQTS